MIKTLPLREQILDFVKNYPSPSFFVAKNLKLSPDAVQRELIKLREEGRTQAFEVSLLGIKQMIYYQD